MFHALAKVVPENESDTKLHNRFFLPGTRCSRWAAQAYIARFSHRKMSHCKNQKTCGCTHFARTTLEDSPHCRSLGSDLIHDMRDRVLLITLRECVPKLRFNAQPADTGHSRIPQYRLETSKRNCRMVLQGSRSGRTSLCARHESLCTALSSWKA
jgi:hypothetical protein